MWDRTKSKSGGGAVIIEEVFQDSNEECEEYLEFADVAILVLLRRFKTPLENAGISISEAEMLDEWHDLITYTKK